MLASSKLNSMESKISEALINNEICYEDFIITINEKRLNDYGVKGAILKKLIKLKKVKK